MNEEEMCGGGDVGFRLEDHVLNSGGVQNRPNRGCKEEHLRRRLKLRGAAFAGSTVGLVEMARGSERSQMQAALAGDRPSCLQEEPKCRLVARGVLSADS